MGEVIKYHKFISVVVIELSVRCLNTGPEDMLIRHQCVPRPLGPDQSRARYNMQRRNIVPFQGDLGKLFKQLTFLRRYQSKLRKDLRPPPPLNKSQIFDICWTGRLVQSFQLSFILIIILYYRYIHFLFSNTPKKAKTV